MPAATRWSVARVVAARSASCCSPKIDDEHKNERTPPAARRRAAAAPRANTKHEHEHRPGREREREHEHRRRRSRWARALGADGARTAPPNQLNSLYIAPSVLRGGGALGFRTKDSAYKQSRRRLVSVLVGGLVGRSCLVVGGLVSWRVGARVRPRARRRRPLYLAPSMGLFPPGFGKYSAPQGPRGCAPGASLLANTAYYGGG